MFARFAALSALLLGGCTAPADAAIAMPPYKDPMWEQSLWVQACTDSDEWDKPAPPFRLYGETYYVGTCGISALLIASPEGHVLIDTGTEKGAEVVLANIRALGFDPRDVKFILMSHEHFDHVGGMARVQQATGAVVIATRQAAEVLKSGKQSTDDPQAGYGHPDFPPVEGPISTLARFEPFMLGTRTFTPIATPGHTLGAVSWRWKDCLLSDCETFVYADSMNPISGDGYRFSDHPALVAAFRKGIADLAASPCSVVLAPHPGGANLRRRLTTEAMLFDQEGCKAYAAGVTERLDARLAKEAAGD